MDVFRIVDEWAALFPVCPIGRVSCEDPALIRLWGRENGVPQVGSAFIFNPETAEALSYDLFGGAGR